MATQINFDSYTPIKIPLPKSDLFELRSSASAGRGVFAKQELSQGRLLLCTSNSEPTIDQEISSIRLKSNGCVCADDPDEPAANLTDDDEHGSVPLNPIAYTIFRPYRKEVCGECFRYDRGREWKIKAPGKHISGIAFCSENCALSWVKRYGEDGVKAFASLEAASKQLRKRVADTPSETNADSSGKSSLWNSKPDAKDEHPGKKLNGDSLAATVGATSSLDSIRQHWHEAKSVGDVIVKARERANPSKAEKRTLRSATETVEADEDVLYYLLTGLLSAHISMASKSESVQMIDGSSGSSSHESLPEVVSRMYGTNAHPTRSFQSEAKKVDEGAMKESNRQSFSEDKKANREQQPISPPAHPPITTLLPSLLALTPDPTCYAHPTSSIKVYTASYLLLLAILPSTLIPLLTPTLAHELNSRAAHNAFSIRPSGTTDGEQSGEYMGWGVWPEASFFNHSCASNVSKLRVGRQWTFSVASSATEDVTEARTAAETVKAGDELCITYLGGDERDLNLEQRRKRLFDGWGFHCQCTRCVAEEERLKQD